VSEIGATPGLVKSFDDKVLETLEGQVDFVEGYQRKFFEGQQLAQDELDRRFRELAQLARAITTRVTDIGVKVVGAFPETMGRGARFVAFDLQGNEYKIDLHADDEARMRGDTFDAQLDGIDSVNIAEKAIREARDKYIAEARLAALGLVKGEAKK
jgi:hypothetical protein